MILTIMEALAIGVNEEAFSLASLLLKTIENYL